jgi:hypothetical protein
MVALKKALKASSLKKESVASAYELRSVIRCAWKMPDQLDLQLTQDFAGGLNSYSIRGLLRDVDVNPAKWKMSPHRALANLQAYTGQSLNGCNLVDPKAMTGFIRHYGFLRGRLASGKCRDDFKPFVAPTKELVADPRFGIEFLNTLADGHPQSLLRFAWETGDGEAIEVLKAEASRGMSVGIAEPTGAIDIRAGDLWTLVCILFLRDHGAAKAGRCLNPLCPTPYFIRNRKTQRICESGECVKWAQRRHALNWWREHHGKRSTGGESK